MRESREKPFKLSVPARDIPLQTLSAALCIIAMRSWLRSTRSARLGWSRTATRSAYAAKKRVLAFCKDAGSSRCSLMRGRNVGRHA